MVTNGGLFVVQARTLEIIEHAKGVKKIESSYRVVIEKEEIFAPGLLEFIVNKVEGDSWLLSQRAISVIGYVGERPAQQGVQAVSYQQAQLVILPVLTRPRAPRTWLEDVN
ncbi:MAG: hypothetical protein Q8S33_09645 [Myxococcales bacterium]|nr:hypothetical protein [Myxococcales bacterium]